MAARPIRDFRTSRKNARAFSLVEVVLAMGIIAFALIILLALLPVGLKSNSDSMGESQAVNLLQALIADRQAAAPSSASTVYSLPAISSVSTASSNTFYVMEDAVTTSTQPNAARYRVDYALYPSKSIYPSATNYPSASVPMPVIMDLRVSWPAATQSIRPASVETVATFMQP